MKTKIIKRAYKFRIYPTLEQISFFAKSFGCVRKVHNLMLDDRKKAYEEYKSTGIKTKYPTPAKYKEEYPYLKEVDSLALANAQLNLEKAYWYGRKIVKVATFYPSSKTCSSCGNIKATLKLSERIYHCECCGLEIDRDYNASMNILRKGLEILKEEKVS